MKRSHVFGTAAAFALAVCTAAAQSTATQDTNGQSGSNRHNEAVTVTGCLTPGSGAGSTGSMSGTTGTSGSSSSNVMSGRWILTNASFSGGALGTGRYGAGSTTGSSAGQTAGTQSSTATSAGTTASGQSQSGQYAGASGPSFTLVGHEKDLQKYANSRVEIRGTLEGSSSSNPVTSGSSSMGSSTTGTSGTGSTGSTTGSSTSGAGSSTASGSSSYGSGSTSASAASGQTLRVDSVKKISGSCSGQ